MIFNRDRCDYKMLDEHKITLTLISHTQINLHGKAFVLTNNIFASIFPFKGRVSNKLE